MACPKGQRNGLWEYCAWDDSLGARPRGLLEAGIRADWAGRVWRSSEGNMKKKLMLVVAVTMLSVSYGAGRAAAQGPAGAGAGGGGAASNSGGSGHSLNPIKWVKKDKSSSDQADTKEQKDQKLTANLQAQGVLPANIDAKAACDNFKTREECVAALHASKNLGLDFNCLKSSLTGVLASADMSSCRSAGGDKGIGLSKAIHLLKPEADAKGEAKRSEKQAKDDLKAAGA